MILKWFATADTERFGSELAASILGELKASLDKRDAKFAAKADKVLRDAAQRVHEFTSRESMNLLKKAKLANSFLWALKDGGCPEDYANELTAWLTARL